MQTKDQPATLVAPPTETPGLKLGNWSPVSGDDPIVDYIAANLWEGSHPPEGWQVARRSQAVYVYRESESRWQVVAKFYVVKTGDKAEKHAARELSLIEQAHRASLAQGPIRALNSYAAWRGVLFLEYVDGLTLEDVIAVRRSRPGTVIPALGKIAQMFAKLHCQEASPTETRDPIDVRAEAHRIIDNLSKYGVLKGNSIVRDGLIRQIGWWADRVEMHNYTPAVNHGDATTTNFIFTNGGEGLVAIDWERSTAADPAADLGRMAAEVEHSIGRHGGNAEEARPLIDAFMQVYGRSMSKLDDAGALLERSRYYRAITSLRIARNGWLSRLERTQLVAQAMALLV